MGRKVKTENRDTFLRAAYKLFINLGYENVPTTMIAKEAGIHHASMFRYFASKEDILSFLFESIEKKMITYLNLSSNREPLQNYVIFSIMKYEFSLLNPDYFRLRASLIKKTDAFIKMFLTTLSILIPENSDADATNQMPLDWFYILGGTLLLQYEFITNYSGIAVSAETKNFLTNYDSCNFSEDSADKFRTYMYHSIRRNVQIFTNGSGDGDEYIACANKELAQIDIVGFRDYYERELNLV